jgi:hypothetical protein
MFLCEILYVEGISMGEYVGRLSININVSLGSLWFYLESRNVNMVVIHDLKTSYDPYYIEVDIHTDETHFYGELVKYLRAVLILPEHMFRSNEFVDFMDTFSKAYNTLHFDMVFIISDWGGHVQAFIKEFKNVMPPSKAVSPIPIDKVREFFTAVGKSCVKNASQEILNNPLFNLSLKKLYEIVAEKKKITMR